MLLTNLADVCRTSGLSVTEHDGWSSRAWRGQGLRAPRGVLCHWTGSPTTATNPTAGLSIVRDGRPDLEGPLAQLYLDYHGGVHVLAAGWCNHAGSGSGAGLAGNPDCIGIECGCAGGFSPAQLDAYPRLVAALQRGYRMEPRCAISHQEWAPGRKVDIHSWPGGMDAFRAAVASPSTTHPTEENDMNADQDRALAAIWKYLCEPGGRGHQADDTVLGVLPSRRDPTTGEQWKVADQGDTGVLAQAIRFGTDDGRAQHAATIAALTAAIRALSTGGGLSAEQITAAAQAGARAALADLRVTSKGA